MNYADIKTITCFVVFQGALQAQKFQFDIEVLRATDIPLADENVYVCWTRGAHLATTKEASVDMKGTGEPASATRGAPPQMKFQTKCVCCAAVFNQKLTLLCTMYQSSSGKFQEKMSKVAVRLSYPLAELLSILLNTHIVGLVCSVQNQEKKQKRLVDQVRPGTVHSRLVDRLCTVV